MIGANEDTHTMSDSTLHVEPTPPVGGAAPVLPVRPEHSAAAPADGRPEPDRNAVAAITGGNLRATYALFIVDPDTENVVIRIKDATTDQVLSELPSREVQAMTRYLKSYAETLARHRAANGQQPAGT
jgi:hypothetical protein